MTQYRVRKAIAVARDRSATDDELCAAGDASWSAAKPNLWYAASAAARATALTAARAATEPAAQAAAFYAALSAARASQESRLRQYLIHGEAAKDMPWPEGAE